MIILTFDYKDMGYGILKVIDNNTVIWSGNARTGSITSNAKGIVLKNALPQGLWYGMEKPVFTNEDSMCIGGEPGWKFRLYDQQRTWTHYLIHPDGNRPGTKGCIGLQLTHLELKSLLTFAVLKYKEIRILVSTGAALERE
jgi:hypothetical protein